jgi:DNA-binding Lrp family transcriptional regulator
MFMERSLSMATKLTAKQMAKRNERIAKLASTGKYSIRQLAEKVGLSKTRVHEIISRA